MDIIAWALIAVLGTLVIFGMVLPWGDECDEENAIDEGDEE